MSGLCGHTCFCHSSLVPSKPFCGCLLLLLLLASCCQTNGESHLTVTPKFPWNDPFIINMVLTRCSYRLYNTKNDFVAFKEGIVTIQTVPVGGYAFSGTSLDFVGAMLAPVPSGVQEVSITCTFPIQNPTNTSNTTTPSS